MLFRTKSEAATVHQTGWSLLNPSFEITRIALVDSETPEPLLARLTYADAKAAAARLGGRLPTRDEVLELVSVGHIIQPVTLSYGPEMVTRAHAEQHDAIMWQRLSKWDKARPVMNAGKHWIEGASGENVRICGWWDGKKLIQSGIAKDNPHHIGAARTHHDYGTTTLVMRPSLPLEPLDVPALTSAAEIVRSLFLGGHAESPGDAVVRVARGYVGTQEATGRNDGAAIKAFFAGCTRRVQGIERPTGWASGWDWCAAFASWCVHVALGLPVGAVVPVGRRIAVRELVEDARAAGRLETSSAYRPKPGDLWIGARGGGDPLLGGTGHVRIAVEAGPTTYTAIGGNEGNAVHRGQHRYDDATWRAWVRVT